MTNTNSYEAIIIGGSYAGLSAGMSLGRSLRKVLIIDSGKPCNRQTPHSHNFITQDGNTPKQIASAAKEQVAKYNSIAFLDDLATAVSKNEKGFAVSTQSGQQFFAKKIILATGLKDNMPAIPGFAECWGITVVHCPYCHGYEVRNVKTGVMGNGDMGAEYAKMIHHWTKEVTLFTNGKSTLTTEQISKLEQHNIPIIETEIESIVHQDGQLQNIVLKDGSTIALKAFYAKAPFVQHTNIAAELGCEFNEQGIIKVDMFQKTNVPGVFACGDNAHPMRSVAMAVAAGNMAGAAANKELIDEAF